MKKIVGLFRLYACYYIMGIKLVMKASERDGSDVPKIITNNTLGYKSPGWKEQTQDIITDKDEGAYIWMKNRAS